MTLELVVVQCTREVGASLGSDFTVADYMGGGMVLYSQVVGSLVLSNFGAVCSLLCLLAENKVISHSLRHKCSWTAGTMVELRAAVGVIMTLEVSNPLRSVVLSRD